MNTWLLRLLEWLGRDLVGPLADDEDYESGLEGDRGAPWRPPLPYCTDKAPEWARGTVRPAGPLQALDTPRAAAQPAVHPCVLPRVPPPP